MARVYFIVYDDCLEAVESLSEAERGRLFTALPTYGKTGALTELRGNERFVLPLMKVNIDRDNRKYAEKCLKTSGASRKDGAARTRSIV